MGTLRFIRHGQASLFRANYDELSELGRAQAAAFGQAYAGRGEVPTGVFHGPAQRQRDTEALARGEVVAVGGSWPAARELAGLDEHDAFGMIQRALPKLSGDPAVARAQATLADADTPADKSRGFQVLFEAIMARWLVGDVDAADAEPWPDFRTRVLRALDEMLSGSGGGAKVLAFSSVGPLAVILQRALGTEDLATFETAWRFRNAAVASFVFRGDRLTLDGFNDLSHLPDPQHHTFR